MPLKKIQNKLREPSFILMILFLTAVLPFIGYHMLMHLFYHPMDGAYGGREVFFRPRYLMGCNNLPTGIFSESGKLFTLGVPIIVIVLVLYFYFVDKVKRYWLFLVGLYLSSFSISLLFVGFTKSGFAHLALNAKSINNGLWVGVQQLIYDTKWSGGVLSGLHYLFAELFGNSCVENIVGFTHPPLAQVISLAIFRVGEFLFPLNPAFGWAVSIAAFSSLLVPLVTIISANIFSKETSRFVGFILVLSPTVLMHQFSMLEFSSSVIFALGLLAFQGAIKYSLSEKSSMFFGGLVGFFFTVVAQYAYSYAVPIVSFVFSFILININYRRKLAFFLLSMLIAPTCYFIFEYFISDGGTFYLKRALACVEKLNEFGAAARPYPVSQFANFTITGIMGGLFFLPSLVVSLPMSVSLLFRSSTAYLKQQQFFSLSVFIMFALLVFFIRTPLEVERTWHWAIVAGWPLVGLFVNNLQRVARSQNIKHLFLWIGLVQLFISLTLSLTVQDYY